MATVKTGRHANKCKSEDLPPLNEYPVLSGEKRKDGLSYLLMPTLISFSKTPVIKLLKKG